MFLSLKRNKLIFTNNGSKNRLHYEFDIKQNITIIRGGQCYRLVRIVHLTMLEEGI